MPSDLDDRLEVAALPPDLRLEVVLDRVELDLVDFAEVPGDLDFALVDERDLAEPALDDVFFDEAVLEEELRAPVEDFDPDLLVDDPDLAFELPDFDPPDFAEVDLVERELDALDFEVDDLDLDPDEDAGFLELDPADPVFLLEVFFVCGIFYFLPFTRFNREQNLCGAITVPLDRRLDW